MHGDAETLTFEGFADFILSGPYQTLRRLQFFAPINYIGSFGYLDFPRIKKQIKQLSDSHKLIAFETLEISLDITNVDSTFAEAERIYAEIGTWLKEMDAILGQDPGFPSLQQVSITVYVTCTASRCYDMKFDEKHGDRLAKIYNTMARKLRKKCFNHLSGLDLDVEYVMELSLPDWDMMYMTS